MRVGLAAFLLLMAAGFSRPAFAHHPGADLDKVMGSKERYFEAVDRPTPPFRLVDAGGKTVELSTFADKVVVLHFVYTACPDVCPLHAEKLAEVQRSVNRTPMKDMVRFVTITTDPARDTRDVLKAYGPAHGLDASNWDFLTVGPDQDERVTRKLAEAFGHKFIRADDGYQTHGVVTHVIDRNGRWAANFHGLRFEALNMVLYVNGLTNNTQTPPAPGWWARIKRLFL